MGSLSPLPRRGFLGLALGVSGGLLTGGGSAMAALGGERGALVYDARIPAADRFAQSVRGNYASIHALEGDRVRFARALIAKPRHTLSGLTRYPDFVLLAGTAAEVGYRLIAESRHATKGGVFIAWTMRLRRAAGPVLG